MKRRYMGIFGSIFIWLFSVAILFPSTARALTWPEALALAEQNNVQVKSAQKQVEASQWSYYKAYGNFLPQVSASASAGGSLSGSGSERYSYGISASQTLFKGLGNYYNLRSAELDLAYDRLNLQKAQADVFYAVRLGFVALFLAQQDVEVQQQIKDDRDKNARMIKLLYDSGKEDKGNYLRTQAQLAEAEHDVLAAKRQLELAQLKLDQLIGCGAVTADDPGEAKPVAAPDLDQLTKNSLSYQMAANQLEQAQINNDKTIGEYLPSLTLSAGWQKSGSSWPPEASSRSWSLSASLPIFPGGTNIADSFINGLLLAKAREDMAQSQKDAYYNIKQAYIDLEDRIEAYSVQKLFLAAAQERARISQVKYLNGLSSYNDWDQIQTDYVGSRNSLLNSSSQALTAEADWYRSYGEWVK